MKLILLTSALMYASPTGDETAAHSAHQEAKPAEKSHQKKKAHKDEGGLPELPSTLSKSRLCAELQMNARAQLEARAKLEVEKAAVKKEKARLKEMLKEIEKARGDLRNETKRLEQLIAKTDVRKRDLAGREKTDSAKKTSNGKKTNTPARDAQENWEALAKTLKSMKPEQAAALLSRTKKSLTAEVLRRMKPADAGAVIEKLKPELAADMLAAMVSDNGDEGVSSGDTKKEKRK